MARYSTNYLKKLMSDLPLLLLIILVTYCLFVGITLIIGTLLFPVLTEEELDGRIAARKGK
jgi:hypothetical protein